MEAELEKQSVKDLRKKLTQVRKKACPKVSGLKKKEVVAEIAHLAKMGEHRIDAQKAEVVIPAEVVSKLAKEKAEKGSPEMKEKMAKLRLKKKDKPVPEKKKSVTVKPAKGSPEMKEMMAKLRAKRKDKA